MLSVILPDFFVRHRHFGFDVPPDQLHPYELIPDILPIGIQGYPLPLHRLQELIRGDFPLLLHIIDRIRHLLIPDGDPGFPGFLFHQEIVDHPIQKGQLGFHPKPSPDPDPGNSP